ncbi:hypothetical protein [Morganella morganii]|uniref:hypothetical protein n=1 Tax=Morganella morganii TaxID=582 RepID=UPI001C482DFF|nr:hypothetical protein [Morganella morganii]QXO64411.1 hypothetical protein JC825_13585 [Morganella morganii]
MAKAAEIAKTDAEWWKHFEEKMLNFNKWVDMENEVFDPDTQYRLKPKFIDIGWHQVPEPVRFPLEIGQKYWVADIANTTDEWLWDDDERDDFLLERGLVHLTEAAAEAHIAALLSFTQK